MHRFDALHGGHTCASRLVQRGVPLKVVQEWMGHKAINMTMRYAHLAPANLLALRLFLHLFVSAVTCDTRNEGAADCQGELRERGASDVHQASI